MLNYIKIKTQFNIDLVTFRKKPITETLNKRDTFRYIKRNEQLIHV